MTAPALPLTICPDCEADLEPTARRCKCGWRRVAEPPASAKPAAAAHRRPALLDQPPPAPPTQAERERARAALAAIRALAGRLRVGRNAGRPAPKTEVERIIACTHPRYADPEVADRFGCGGYARRCLDCGHLDFVLLTPQQVEALAVDAARVPIVETVTIEAEPGANG